MSCFMLLNVVPLSAEAKADEKRIAEIESEIVVLEEQLTLLKKVLSALKGEDSH